MPVRIASSRRTRRPSSRSSCSTSAAA